MLGGSNVLFGMLAQVFEDFGNDVLHCGFFFFVKLDSSAPNRLKSIGS
jgi:hypothetical protein